MREIKTVLVREVSTIVSGRKPRNRVFSWGLQISFDMLMISYRNLFPLLPREQSNKGVSMVAYGLVYRWSVDLRFRLPLSRLYNFKDSCLWWFSGDNNGVYEDTPRNQGWLLWNVLWSLLKIAWCASVEKNSSWKTWKDFWCFEEFATPFNISWSNCRASYTCMCSNVFQF